MNAGGFGKVSCAATLAGLLVAGVVSCARPVPTERNDPGQTGPDYELDVAFHDGVSKKTAIRVVNRCAGHNPAVVRTSAVHLLSGEPRVYVAKVFANTTMSERAKELVSCFDGDKSVVSAGWPS